MPVTTAQLSPIDQFTQKLSLIMHISRFLVLIGSLFLAGCAANQMAGFENTYQSYNIPQPLLDRITFKFREHRLANARITRDNVGRVRLAGSYRNEDEVDRAFIITQSIVGLKSTSPFYPEDIKETRWEIEAAEALKKYTKTTSIGPAAPSKKRALVIGINTFRDKKMTPIPGEDDAIVVKERAEKAGYKVNALLGKDATKANIEGALRKLEGELGSEDSLFIYISSHGTPPVQSPKGKDQRKMSIVAWDSGDNDNKKSKDATDWYLNVQETSVSDELVQRLGKKPTRFTRILIDTCYSGEMLKDRPVDESRRYIEKVNGGQTERAGIALASWSGSEYTSKGIRFNAESEAGSPIQANTTSRQKNVGATPASPDRSGYTIITATSENEKSWAPNGPFPSPVSSGKMLKGSYFTQTFFEYLDQQNGQIEPAFEAAKEFTQKKVSTIPPPAGPVHQVPRVYSTVPTNQNNLNQ